MKKVWFYMVLTSIIISCNTQNDDMKEKSNKLKSIEDVDQSKLSDLSSKSIFFGHMSVGRNILNGAERIATEKKLKLNFINWNDTKDASGFGLMHCKVGSNGKPMEKLHSFDSKLAEAKDAKIDVALLKFCYVDITKTTNIDSIFNQYVATFDSLQSQYPDITFAHTTVPLRTIDTGLKAFAKKMMGKSIGLKSNEARNKFNDMLRNKYKDKAPIFDIAKFEAMKQDGSYMYSMLEDKKVYTLVPEYTKDGGHLNKMAEDYLGEQFLVFLSEI